MPLPSSFSEAENIGFIPVAATLTEGSSVSKYFQDIKEELFTLNVKDTPSWKDVEDDPVFHEIATECDYVPFEDLIQRRNELWGLDRNMDLESEEGEVQETDGYHDSNNYFQPQSESHQSGFDHLPNPEDNSYSPSYQRFEEDGDEETRAARAT